MDTDTTALLAAGGTLAAGGAEAGRRAWKHRGAQRADATDTALAEVVRQQREHEALCGFCYPARLRVERLEQLAARALKAQRLPVPPDVRQRLARLWTEAP